MNNQRGFRRVAVFASVAALAGGALAGCGSSSDASSSSAPTQTQQQSGQPPQGGGFDVSALAQALGVSESKLQAAMQKNAPQPGSGSPDDMVANLAQELGLSESKVKAALDELAPQGGAPPAATPSATTTTS